MRGSGFALAYVVALGACDYGSYFPGGGGDDPDGAPGTERYHPADFALAEVHGPETNLQVQDCRTCHGEDLNGVGAAVSCDGCHTPEEPKAWRSNCTFCHGGETDSSGAPPRNLDGTSDPSVGSFPPHTAHVNPSGMAVGFDCVQCHVKATDVLTLSHVFDDTKGQAEVDMGSGFSGLGQYSRETGCTATYCHGGGRSDVGSIATSAGAMTCESCHAGMAGGPAAWSDMSGFHSLHLQTGDETCGDCHNNVTANGTSIDKLELHVNGQRDVAFREPAVTYDRATQKCSGTCHGHPHADRPWAGIPGGGTVHPAGFSAPSMHGPETNLQRQDCRGCHGQELTGNGAAVSCDGCHSPTSNPTAWRTNCTFCHGGDDNQTGAPPHDLSTGSGSASLSFRAHTRHVTQRIAAASECRECHTTPTNVLSASHMFDATPNGVAEVRLSVGSYSAGTCSNLYCHGNGRGSNGTVTDGVSLACDGCHPGINNDRTRFSQMSRQHPKHLPGKADCADCHRTVTADNVSIAAPLLHIDGANQIDCEVETIDCGSPANPTCTGPCHGENHNGESW